MAFALLGKLVGRYCIGHKNVSSLSIAADSSHLGASDGLGLSAKLVEDGFSPWLRGMFQGTPGGVGKNAWKESFIGSHLLEPFSIRRCMLVSASPALRGKSGPRLGLRTGGNFFLTMMPYSGLEMGWSSDSMAGMGLIGNLG